MVLTAAELLHVGGIPDCWRDGSPQVRAAYEENERYVRDDVAAWADFTLQLHLELSAHSAWFNRENKRLSRRSRRTTAS
jgi:hypothetical protein